MLRFKMLVFCLLFTLTTITSHAAPTPETALAAMKKAADFMTNTVSNHGGYVYAWSENLSQQWGEIPARPTQVWTQPPGTPTVGMMYLDANKATGETAFLDFAKRAADALIWGQHPAGGWHYVIDFDMPGLRKWYDEVASKCWGWEEYYHYYGNCTYDDQATSAPTEFLLELYTATLDPAYREPLLRALGFILESQYPNGAWPQRYPIMDDYPHDGHADYTPYYTFNDGVIVNNIELLIPVWEKLGDEKYWKAALRGMDFYLISQLPKPQAGWAQQYTLDMQPGAGRSYEPAAVSVHRTVSNLKDLMKFYAITGDRRYLAPVPAALEWLVSSKIHNDPSKNYTHAGFYEPGTNKPLYYHFTGESKEESTHRIDYIEDGAWWYRKTAQPNIDGLRREYERLMATSPEEARAEYEASKQQPKPSPVDTALIEEIISSLDSRGAWITEVGVTDFSKGMLSLPPKKIRGIDIRVFIRNMRTLTGYFAEKKD